MIETERLLLRPPQPDDFEPFAAFMADAEATHHLGGTQARSVAWRTFVGMGGQWSLFGVGMFQLIDKASGRWLGRVGPHRPEGWPGTEVGWGVVREAWGQGYAHEAAVASMDWAIDRLGWDDIIHAVAPANVASAALARKLGSVNRGPGRLPEPFAEIAVDIWGQTAAEWKARRR